MLFQNGLLKKGFLPQVGLRGAKVQSSLTPGCQGEDTCPDPQGTGPFQSLTDIGLTWKPTWAKRFFRAGPSGSEGCQQWVLET